MIEAAASASIIRTEVVRCRSSHRNGVIDISSRMKRRQPPPRKISVILQGRVADWKAPDQRLLRRRSRKIACGL